MPAASEASLELLLLRNAHIHADKWERESHRVIYLRQKSGERRKCVIYDLIPRRAALVWEFYCHVLVMPRARTVPVHDVPSHAMHCECAIRWVGLAHKWKRGGISILSWTHRQAQTPCVLAVFACLPQGARRGGETSGTTHVHIHSIACVLTLHTRAQKLFFGKPIKVSEKKFPFPKFRFLRRTYKLTPPPLFPRKVIPPMTSRARKLILRHLRRP